MKAPNSARVGSRTPGLTVSLRINPGDTWPTWTPVQPPGGWTPLAVLDAACEYADEHAGRGGLSYERLAKFAYRDLLYALPIAVKRRELHDRFAGVDILGQRFGRPRDHDHSTADEPDF